MLSRQWAPDLDSDMVDLDHFQVPIFRSDNSSVHTSLIPPHPVSIKPMQMGYVRHL
jgi:hypothetical protein